MKVTCQSCQAKYSIADEKVRGKIAKIRCKKCGTTIVVNGTAIDASGADVPVAPEGSADAMDRSPADDTWTVLVDDGDQRTLTVPQIRELFADGTVRLDTHVWKDGMEDWLPIQQVEALRAALEGSASAALGGVDLAAAAPGAGMDGAGTALGGLDGVGLDAPRVSEPAPAGPATGRTGTTGRPAAQIPQQQLAARTEPRKPGRGGTTDLFGASGGDDVLQGGGGQGSGPQHDRPTGARNENSVLFSLSALTGTQPAQSEDRAKSAARASTGNGVSGGSKNKLDDILNLGGGGIYAPSLAAPPVLAPPPVDEPAPALDTPATGPKQSKGKGLMFGIVGALLGAGIAVAAVLNYVGTQKTDESSSPGTSNSARAASGAASSETLTGAPTASQARTGSDAPPTESASAPPAPPTALVPGAVPVTPKPAAEADKPAQRPTGGAAPRPASETPKPTGVAAIGAAIAQEKPTPAPAAPAAAAAAPGASFDRAAAISTLSSIASAVQVCKRPDGPTGQGRVAITFANSGSATTANIEGPPFAGTPVGGCVAARFRSARVPAFSGDPVTVHKSFQIN